MIKRYALLALLGLAYTLPSLGQSIRLVNVFPSRQFAGPTEMQPVPGRAGRVAVAYQEGTIRMFNLGDTAAGPAVMLDLTTLTSANGEMGLLGMAFHPRFPQVKRVYVNYVANIDFPNQRETHIASFEIDTTTMQGTAASEVVHLTYPQPFPNHKGGKVEFGPDGMLYIAAGDGGSQQDPSGNGQSKRTLLAKILRIDIDSADPGLGTYAIPADNPFADSALPVRREIYAYGLRNPWRFSWDAPTYRLWVADVGQNTYEEIDTVVSGGNYGWRYREGYNCNDAYPNTCTAAPNAIDPIWQYRHVNGNVSITGGYVYRGSRMPVLAGTYIYGDYSSGRIWSLAFGGDTLLVNTLLLTSPSGIYAFGRDGEGEIYVLRSTGAISRIVAVPTVANKPIVGIAGLHLHPIPAAGEATLEFTLAQAGPVQVRLLTAAGQWVQTVSETTRTAGTHTVRIPLAGLAPGMYGVQVETPAGQTVRRLAVAR